MTRRSTTHRSCGACYLAAWLLWMGAVPVARAQEADTSGGARRVGEAVEGIDRKLSARRAKARSGAGRPIGFTPRLGGLQEGAGLTAGVRLEPARELRGMTFAAEGLASLRLYWGVRGVFGYDAGTLVAYAYGQHRHLPEEDFYGVGASAPEAARATYRLDEGLAGALGGVRLLRRAFAGAHASYQWNRIGAGKDDGYPTVQEAFDTATAPGLAAGIDYVMLGGWVEVDSRDLPYFVAYGSRFAPTHRLLRGLSLGATRGLYLSAEVMHHLTAKGGAFDFTQVEAEAQAYLPGLKAGHVVALRPYATLTHAPGANRTPFYLLPTLGGAHTLRGFDAFRFRDRHALLVNTEYRLPVFFALDVALFADVGQVFHDTGDLGFDQLEAGYGVGLRFRTFDRVFARLDVARSREGMGYYLLFGSFF